MRKRWVYVDGEPIEVTKDYAEPAGPFVWGDLPAYESPASGQMIEGRVARREDFKRTGTRAWEGKDAELAEAKKRVAESEAKLDKSAEAAAWRAWYQLDPDKRRQLREY